MAASAVPPHSRCFANQCRLRIGEASTAARISFARALNQAALQQQQLPSGRFWLDDAVVGVLGGGQLGRMLCEAGSAMGVKVAVLDPSAICPASALAHRHVVAEFDDRYAVLEFAKACDVVTMEIEHVDAGTLDELEKQGVRVEPSSSTIKTIQDKYRQKLHFRKYGVPVPEFVEVTGLESLEDAASVLGYPFMLKCRRFAYDGRGNIAVRSKSDLLPSVKALGGFEQGLFAEKWVSFEKELAVMVARGIDGTTRCYQLVETTQRRSICHTVLAPALIPKAAEKTALDIAAKAVASFGGAGVFCVEQFLASDNLILLNEVAPRPHNSGHLTIEACYVSQFEQHLRAVLGLPLGDTSMKVSAAGMYNILAEEGELGASIAQKIMNKAFSIPGASVHWYHKRAFRRQRKMGHVTVVGPSMAIVKQRMRQITDGSEAECKHPTEKPAVGIIMGSDSDLSTMRHAGKLLDRFGVKYQMTIVSAHRTAERMYSYASNAHLDNLNVIIAGAGGAAHLPGMVGSITPLPAIGVPVDVTALRGLDSFLSIAQMPTGIPVATVAVDDAENAGLLAVRILGTSDEHLQSKVIAHQGEERRSQCLEKLEAFVGSDIYNAKESAAPPVVGILTTCAGTPEKAAAAALELFGVPCEIVAVSSNYVKNAHAKGLKVLVVVSIGYSELPGIVAGATPLPVIGVPTSKGSLKHGVEHPIAVQPEPVAWVAVDNGANAGILAARFLQVWDPRMLDKMISYKEELERKVMEKAERLEAMGWENYLREKAT
ncbi:phosphoribosylaminoimidazole carboxylase, chloroplastic isoform X2 [Selaginella moellendorffii]|uniref:phosphoribosylaminoimidazole carboxylase, chloroplastic isoform X2 n=1 Tax=Selaginella moellendorffii TaxID=88036 RepID=UPI000D1CE368|nr:phosphoribosylaminoimidazole carboxylase, chloroplastic isoform X2 [Selaginella moellendorffii]|eukprot:XP_024524038.1 phosphoribosylaminoimidazole carboxylase, chloroplastic isoform X2 [Selaginella moellendorffii]